MKYPELQQRTVGKPSNGQAAPRNSIQLPADAVREMVARRNKRPATEEERWIIYGMAIALGVPRDYEFDDEVGFRFVPKEMGRSDR